MSHCFRSRTDKIYSNNSLPGFFSAVRRNKWYKETPQCTCMKASFTIEAAVILPMLACFFVSILFFFRILQAELQVERALVDAGQTLAAYETEDEKSGRGALGMAALKLAVSRELADKEEVLCYVTGGAAGVSLLGSGLDADFVDIRASFRVKVPIALFGRHDIKIERRVCCRKWTGWHGGDTEGENEIWVYIAETGEVYHLSRECTHLSLSVKKADKNKVKNMRNENGAKYRECARCAGADKGQADVYITDQGDRYHYDLHCSGLKRTISMIKISDVGQRRQCSRCGGN